MFFFSVLLVGLLVWLGLHSVCIGRLTGVLGNEENMNHLSQFLSALNVGAGSLKITVLYLLVDVNVFLSA